MLPSRRQFWFVLFALLMMRVVVGLHFFSEGTSKVKSGDFSCAPFLGQATGPFDEFFRSILDDADGRLRLCISPDSSRIDTAKTFAIWNKYVENASKRFGFDAQQAESANTTLDQSKKHLDRFLQENQTEILAWIDGEDRLKGFTRDGQHRSETALHVQSLRNQVESIKRDRARIAAPWLTEVESSWNELQARINLIGGVALESDRFLVSRPFAQPWSKQDIVDRLLPWFDIAVGFLLVIGLFTRIAAFAGIGLLLGVVATQPFWIPGAENTFNQWIEMGSLTVLFATAAGRFGGLDYFFGRRRATEHEA